jgi:hypothetical protein
LYHPRIIYTGEPFCFLNERPVRSEGSLSSPPRFQISPQSSERPQRKKRENLKSTICFLNERSVRSEGSHLCHLILSSPSTHSPLTHSPSTHRPIDPFPITSPHSLLSTLFFPKKHPPRRNFLRGGSRFSPAGSANPAGNSPENGEDINKKPVPKIRPVSLLAP